MLTFYQFVHCPYCIRVKLALGFLQVPHRSVIVDYDDIALRTRLTGRNQLPIVVDANGLATDESLKIIAELNGAKVLFAGSENLIADLEQRLKHLGSLIHPLVIPYWASLAEFNPQSRRYFMQVQAKKRGSLSSLIAQRDQKLRELNAELIKLQDDLVPYFQRHDLSVADIMLAAHLWGLYLLPQFRFPDAIESYLQQVGSACRFDYFHDLWHDDARMSSLGYV